MSDWSAGYVADIGYTFGYYAELNPMRIRLAFLNAGLVFPEVGHACELGYGQGLSTNIHAAASVTEWHGTDFNPAQAGFAQELAGAGSANVHLYDQPFAEFCSRDDLPDFDSIGLHGIWSWVSDDNRAVIVDFIRRKLKVGGVLYISYNTQPGWAAMVPVRDLLAQHNEVMQAPGSGIAARIDHSLEFVSRLFATNPTFCLANPQIVKRIDKMKEQDRNYVAHEYFNRDWVPMSFAAMADWLEPAKLNFACSAHYLDHIDSVNLSPEQRTFINDVSDPMFKQTVRDFMVNQQFRRDYWVRGARRLSPLDRFEQVRRQRVVLAEPRADVVLKVSGATGEASLQEAIYNPILDYLADHQPRSIAAIEKAMAEYQLSFSTVLEAVFVLLGGGTLYAVQDDAIIARARDQAAQLNLHLCKLARGSGDVGYLASPVTGGAIRVSRVAQLFLLARGAGLKTPAEWGRFVLDLFAQQGQRIVKAGKMLESNEEERAEMQSLVEVFATKFLPIYQALGIVS